MPVRLSDELSSGDREWLIGWRDHLLNDVDAPDRELKALGSPPE